MKLTLNRNYWNDDKPLYKKATVELDTGITVLVGKNGSGKTTFLLQLKQYLDKKKIPYLSYDNMIDGGANSFLASLEGMSYFKNATDKARVFATKAMSSEGQNIVINLGEFARTVGSFVRKNSDREGLFILLDAVDSGLSIDNIIEVKEFLKIIADDAPNAYIIISANSFEMSRDVICYDVRNSKYIEFTDYEDYKDFIVKGE